jgi:GDP-4-dehydro-6-deoxy-D-mannose reductase
MRIVVTGADGFVGRHLCDHLRDKGDVVVPYGGPTAREPSARPIDIRRAADVSRMIADSQPEAVIHLAGWASVGSSYSEPSACFEVNALGTILVLDAIRKHCPKARLLLVSSGEVYGKSAGEGMCAESDPVAPKSPYGISKLAAELVAGQFFGSYATDVVITRSFNHVGQGQGQGFVIPSLAQQIRELAEGKGVSTRLKVGNLDPIRDFTNVLDVVEAYRLLLERGVSGEVYNVCSGRAQSIREVVEALMTAAGVQVDLVVDPERVRATDIARLVGDPRKINGLGWRAHRSPLQGILDAS